MRFSSKSLPLLLASGGWAVIAAITLSTTPLESRAGCLDDSIQKEIDTDEPLKGADLELAPTAKPGKKKKAK